MSKEDKISSLLAGYFLGSLSEEDKAELEAWMEKDEENRLLVRRISRDKDFLRRWEFRQGLDIAGALRKFDGRTADKTADKTLRRKTPSYRKIYVSTAAAAAMLVLAAGLYLHQLSGRQALPLPAENRLASGTHKAVLVLDGGEEIGLGQGDSLELDNTHARILGQDSTLTYKKKENVSGKPVYNTLKVRKGGEYTLHLSDGSKILVNSDSRVRYPVSFDGETRTLEFSGEAFFEVAENAAPFIVRTKGMQIRVYGTSFNVNTRQEGIIRTALVDGKVSLTPEGTDKTYFMSPSQLAEFHTGTSEMDIRTVDLTPYIAWTKGRLVFNNRTLKDITETLSLWFDVDVFYQNPELQELHFTGNLNRYCDLSVLLKALTKGVDAHFRLEGRTLIVYK